MRSDASTPEDHLNEDVDISPQEATRALRHAVSGDAASQQRLFQILESELRALAGRAMAAESPSHTLQPTALVGEVWLKLFGRADDDYQDRSHFLAVAARAMRQILVDHARGRRRIKRGGEWQRVGVEGVDRLVEDGADETLDLVDLDGVLDELRALSPRQADVVEMRFFAGLDVNEVAEALGASERTIDRDWRFARAWLMNRLSLP